jgi:hypothetical protein
LTYIPLVGFIGTKVQEWEGPIEKLRMLSQRGVSGRPQWPFSSPSH